MTVRRRARTAPLITAVLVLVATGCLRGSGGVQVAVESVRGGSATPEESAARYADALRADLVEDQVSSRD